MKLIKIRHKLPSVAEFVKGNSNKLCTATLEGTKEELKMLELLCDRTHHIHKNPTGRKDKPNTCGTCKGWERRKGRIYEFKPMGDCDKGCGVGGVTNIYDDCPEWRGE
jgi:hypothetical protein